MAVAADDAVSNPPEIPTLKPSDNANPNDYFRKFLYKAALITIFLVLLPLFPSLAPEFINQTFHSRSWELLQLIFVGIAVSYGLFSKRNDDMDKDGYYTTKLDNAQSYVSKMLQVSSVFDDELDSQTVIDDKVNKVVQTWNSQYCRGEPVVVVAAKEGAAAEEENGDVSEVERKPLLLPVRSLKQQPIEGGRVRASENSGSRRNLKKLKNVDVGGVNENDGIEDDVVLRSPIPWRSRSGRMEENRDEHPPPSPFLVSPSMRFLDAGGGGDDVVKKKAFLPPPPAPPPPPQFITKPVLAKSNSAVMNSAAAATEKTLTRSVKSVPMEEFSETESDDEPVRRSHSRAVPMGSPQSGRSVRTFGKLKDYDDKRGFSDTGITAKVANELVDKVVVDGDSSDEDEAEGVEYAGGRTDNAMNELGPDVDKKADEFIAKFREQIRLQRIDSIRRSTAQRTGRTFR